MINYGSINNSLMRSNKDEISSWSFADYSKSYGLITIPYTCPCDGYVLSEIYSSYTSGYTVDVNGVRQCQSSQTTSTAGLIQMNELSVKKGDIITTTRVGASTNPTCYCWFIPKAGV